MQNQNPSPILQQLIGYEPKSEEDIRSLNRLEFAGFFEQAIDEAFNNASTYYTLSAKQQEALSSTLRKHLSVIQGPLGTGKTSTAAAILHMNQALFNRVQICAASNNAADEVLMRLLKARVRFYRFWCERIKFL